MILTNDTTMKVLTKALEGTSARHTAITNNISNSLTKDYKADRVAFEDELSRALSQEKIKDSEKLNGTNNFSKPVFLEKTNSKHFGVDISQMGIDAVNPIAQKDKSTSMRLDGNNVDIDIEMSNLAANQLMYESIIRRINGKISSLKSVINMGR